LTRNTRRKPPFIFQDFNSLPGHDSACLKNSEQHRTKKTPGQTPEFLIKQLLVFPANSRFNKSWFYFLNGYP